MSEDVSRLGGGARFLVATKEVLCSRKTVITLVALAAIALITVGALSFLTYFQTPFIQFPLVAKASLLGGGGLLVTALAIYAIKQSITKCQKKEEIQEEEIQEEEIENERISLSAVMQHFGVEDPQLSKDHPSSGEIPNGLDDVDLLATVMLDYPTWRTNRRFITWLKCCVNKINNSNEQTEEGVQRSHFLRKILDDPKPPSTLPDLDTSLRDLSVEKVRMSPSIAYPGDTKAVDDAPLLGEITLATPPTSFPSFDENFNIELILRWTDYFMKLYQSDHPDESAEAELGTFILNAIPSARASTEFLTKLPPEKRQQLFDSINTLTQLLLTLHVTSERAILDPSRMLACLKSYCFLLEVGATLAPSFCNYQYTIDLEYLFLDNYLDLGPYQAEIYDILRVIADKGIAPGKETKKDLKLFYSAFPNTPIGVVRGWVEGVLEGNPVLGNANEEVEEAFLKSENISASKQKVLDYLFLLTVLQKIDISIIQEHTVPNERVQDFRNAIRALGSCKDFEAMRKVLQDRIYPMSDEAINSLFSKWQRIYSNALFTKKEIHDPSYGQDMEDFEGEFLPKPVAQMRSLYYLMEGLFAPHISLDIGQELYKKRGEFPEYWGEVRRKLKIAGSTLRESKELLSMGPGCRIAPTDLHVRILVGEELIDWYKFLREKIHGILSPFANQPWLVRDQEMRARLIEGVISVNRSWTEDRNGGADWEIPVLEERTDFDLPLDGLRQSTLDVLGDKYTFVGLSIEESRDLQLMATGEGNRASNAIYTFAKHPSLLIHEVYAKDFQRIFRLLVFRKDLLKIELETNSSLAENMILKLGELLRFYEENKEFEAWAFIYKFQVDLLKNYPRQFLQDQVETNTKQLEDWIEKIESPGLETMVERHLFTSKRPLYLAYLYKHALLGISDEDTLRICQVYLAIREVVEGLQAIRPGEGQVYFDLHPFVVRTISENVTDLNSYLSYLLKRRELIWNRILPGVYKSGPFLFHLRNLMLVQNGQMEGVLPKKIRQDRAYSLLLGQEAMEKVHNFTMVETDFGPAWRMELNQEAVTHALYLNSNIPQFPLLYRKRVGEESWEQWIQIEEIFSVVPHDFQEGCLWKNEDRYSVERVDGKPLYVPRMEGERLIALDRVTPRGLERVLDPGDERLFSRLENPDSYVITRNSEGVVVEYLNGPMGYAWNPTDLRWESTVMEGYFLSPKPIEKWQRPVAQNGIKPLFFATYFDHYHILENREGRGKLLLAYRPYTREGSYALKPLPHTSRQTKQIAIFDLQKNGHLHSQHPQDFFYLSYALLVQGKYGDALLYLHRSQAVWTMRTEETAQARVQIKGWILDWVKEGDTSPNAHAFVLHMLLLEHQIFESNAPTEKEVLQHDEALLPTLLKSMEYYRDGKSQVDPILHLSDWQLEEIDGIFVRDPKAIKKYFNVDGLQKNIREFYETEPTREAVLAWSLKEQIAYYEEKIASMQIEEQIPVFEELKLPAPLFDPSPWVEKGSSSQNSSCNTFIKEMEGIFQREALSDQLGLELVEDIGVEQRKIEEEWHLKEGIDLSALHETLCEEEKIYRGREKCRRAEICQLFQPPPLASSQDREREILEQEALYDELIEQARYCFGLKDFSLLLSREVIKKEEIDSLSSLVHSYEIEKTNRQLFTRRRESVVRLQGSPEDPLLRKACCATLREKREYNPDTHPYCHLLLLFEDELNLSAREKQIIHIEKLSSHPNAYIHEAMAGGKTTLLRNLFSAIQTQNGYLAGVVTYSPLMAMHHREYANVSQLTLGATAYPLYFDRNARRDATSIQFMILYHLKALIRHGRIDQTPQSVLSLNHTLTEMILACRGAPDAVKKELKPQIEALQRLLRLRGDHLSVYSDEIDKIFDPSKDHNYAFGRAKILRKEFYEPALNLIQLLMTKEPLTEFYHALKGDNLHRISDEKFEEYLSNLAREVYDALDLQIDKKKTLDYLTEVHQADPSNQTLVQNFYQEEILHSSHVQALQTYHVYIGVLLRGIKHKRVGTNFGRSSDGIKVKPYSFSAVCQESSQRSFVLANILELCIDYMVMGVTLEGVSAYVHALKGAASTQLSEENSNLDETPVGKKFQIDFGIFLSEVKFSHYQTIREKVQESPELLCECLREIVLKKYTYYSQKLEGNAHQLTHLIGSFSGSSGSPERVKTLPSSIEKDPDLIRQKGAVGSVFTSLFANFDPENDLIPLGLEHLQKELVPGSTLVDSAPLFSGLRGEEIAQKLSRAGVKGPFRYLDEENDVAIWEDGRSRKGDQNIDPSKVVSIIPHKGRQGTNWTFAPNTVGVITVGMDLDLTSFYQSLMRLRLLGRGQRAKIAYDPTLEKTWEDVPELKDKTVFAKIIWTLVKNEAKVLKRLHYQANQKEIRLVRSRVIDEIKQQVSDLDDLEKLQSLKGFSLVTDTVLDPDKFGIPVTLESPREALGRLLQSEKTALTEMANAVSNLDLTDESKSTVNEILSKYIEDLADGLILSASDLPEKVPTNLSDIDAIEEMEVEELEDVEEEIVAEADFIAELFIEQIQEQEMEMEEDEIIEHPTPQFEEELSQFMLSQSDPWVDVLLRNKPHNLHDKMNPIDPELFPNIWSTCNGLGVLNGAHLTGRVVWFPPKRESVKADTPEGHELRKQKLWCFADELENQTPLSPKLLVIVTPDREIFCQLGSVKDVDFRFFTLMRKYQAAQEWEFLSSLDAKNEEEIPNLEQRVHMREAKGPLTLFNDAFDPLPKDKSFDERQNEICFKLEGLWIYKVDVRETAFPEGLPKQLHEDWIEKMALVKFLHLDANYSKSEREFLSKWLSQPHDGLPDLQTLKTRLEKALEEHYPSLSSHPLLDLLSSPPHA